jgi:uncharacterized repeat protein (TIGR01451 family)
MRTPAGWRVLFGLLVVAGVLVAGVGPASAQSGFHGIGFVKGCDSPTKVGDPMNCSYAILNIVDTADDTLRIFGLSDQVHAAGGNVSSGNILGALQLVFTGPVICIGGSGSGTDDDPYLGATACELPFGSAITTNSHSFYTVTAADYALPNHEVSDTATLLWSDICDGTSNNCTTGPQTNTTGSKTLVEQLGSTTTTDIHDAGHQVVTAVAAGATVHDLVTVTGQPTSPIPSGNVSIDWFTNAACDGANSGDIGPLDGTGHYDASGFAQGPLAAGQYSFRAHYLGDATYSASDGPCEPLQVVDANISITPNGVNRVGQTHTFTAHVNVNSGTGFGPAPDGTKISFTIDSGPGAFTTPNPCTTAGGTGSCTIDLTSLVTGVTTVTAHTTVSVAGVMLTRNTDGTDSNSGPATKTWVNARISITPNATNRVGQSHTFTVKLEKDIGTGTFVPAAGEHVVVALVDANGAIHTAPTGTCADAGSNTDANGQCTITFTSNSTGTVTGHASSTLSVNGSGSFTVQTDGVAPNSGDAVKTFVDARISIAPNATNEIGRPHTFTVTLQKDTGNGAGFVAAVGETVSVSLAGTNGATPSPAGPFTGTTNGSGQFEVTFASATPGKVVGHASSTLSVNGSAQFTVQTDATAGSSGDAVKTFVDANIQITPNGVNRVSEPHTFTAHVNVDAGDGNGYVSAPDGTQISFTIDSGPGAFTTTNPCTTAGGAGSCQITLNSATAGVTTVSAHTTLQVGGVTLTRATDGAAGNSGPASKTYVNARIAIAPNAANEVGAPHTFTVTLSKDTGAGYQPAPNQHVDVTLTDANGAAHTAASGSCTTAGANTDASGQCTVTFTSPTAGTVTAHATSTLPVDGHSITVSTDGTGDNSGDAVKTFVDLNVAIAPTATNEVNANHTFTVTAKQNSGDGNGFVAAPGATVTTGIGNADGATATVKGGTCASGTGANGQCTLVISSPTAGTTTAIATASLTLLGVALTRDTDPATAGIGGGPNGSGPAVKTWVDANIQITPASANNAVGTNHTLTGHVNVNAGSAFANAPAATTIGFSILSGPGSFVGGVNSCATIGATGSCTVQITSGTTGTTVVRATTDVGVGGLTLHRATGDAKAGDSADAAKNWGDATARTDILDASGGVVTSVVAGTVVHDKVFVQRTAGTPASVPSPSGTVVFHRYTTIDCTGTATDQSVALAQGDPSTAITADFAPTAGSMSYKADYLGDANYPARSGACEPLTVTAVPAPAIAIVKNPKGQTVAVGGTARFEITVTNVGNTVLTNVNVTDPLSPNCNRTQAQIPALASMAPNAAVTYSCSRPNVQRAFDNVATATGTPPSGPNVTARDTAPVKVRALTPPKKHPRVISHKKPKATG